MNKIVSSSSQPSDTSELSEDELKLALKTQQKETPEVEIPLEPKKPDSSLKALLEEKYSDSTWKKLAQKSGILWDVCQIFKRKSDMSWKVAVTGAFGVLTGLTKRMQFVDFKQDDLRLNLYILLIGESGWIRKTTTRNLIYDLLMELKCVDIIPPNFTPEGL